MIVPTFYSTTQKRADELQQGDVIVGAGDHFNEIYSITKPSPENDDFIQMDTQDGVLDIRKDHDFQFTVLDDVSLNAYMN